MAYTDIGKSGAIYDLNVANRSFNAIRELKFLISAIPPKINKITKRKMVENELVLISMLFDVSEMSTSSLITCINMTPTICMVDE